MARLLVASGDAPPLEVPLTRNVIRIGRVALNDLVLDDDAVSRIHACLLRRGDRWVLLDADSSSGTFVNGARTTGEVELRDGDEIRAGRSEIHFHEDGAVPEAPPTCPPPPAPATCIVTDRVAQIDERTVQFRVSSAARPAITSLHSRQVATLSLIASAIRDVEGLDDLLEALLDAIHGHFRADRCAVFLREAEDGSLAARALRPREGGFTVSRSILDYAIEHKETVLVADTSEDERFSNRLSIRHELIRSAICAPLVRRERVLGAIYLDFREAALCERSDDVVLLNLIASNAAIAIENAVLARERDAATRLGAEEPGPLVAQSASMQRVRDELARLTEGPGPVLVVGDAGVGKLYAAKSLHKAWRGPDAPFVHVDGQELGSEACEAIFGAPWEPGDERAAKPLIRRAAGGTLALRHIEALPREAQEALEGLLESQAREDLLASDVRVVVLTADDPARLAKDGRIHGPLLARLQARTLRLPRLRERKEDIVPLAAHFLTRRDRETRHPGHTLAPSAEGLLGSLPYRHRNAAELREAIAYAADVAEGATIGVEHVFTGPKEPGKRAEIDLTAAPPVPWLLRRRTLGALRAAGAAVFLGLAAACLVSGAGAAGGLANGLVWGVWWPGLMALFLFAGRVWCAVCPIAATGASIGKAARAERPPFEWLRRNTGWLVGALFVAIVWSEHVLHMSRTPRATGGLFLVLAGLCAAASLSMSRDAWCRFACPLGALGAGYAVSAPLRVHANPAVCGSMCKTHECVKGTASETGCPMFLHPLFARDAQFCKLCLACVRNCPNRSARLWVRPPLTDLWRAEEIGSTLTPFCLVVFLIAPAMLATLGPDSWISGRGGFTAAAAAALLGGLTAGRILPRLLTSDGDAGTAARVAHALLVAAWGPLAAFHLRLVPGLAELRISSPPGSTIGALSLPLLPVAQMACVALAAGLSYVALRRIRAGAEGGTGWTFVRAAWALQALTSLGLAWRAGLA